MFRNRTTHRPPNRFRALCLVTVAGVTIAACSGEDNDDGATSEPVSEAGDVAATSDPPGSVVASTGAAATTELPDTPADPATIAAIGDAIAGDAAGCDPLDTRQCLLPFPSDAYLVDDPSTPSGSRVALPADGMPANASGVKVDVTEWNRSDGFSANSSLVTYVADLDPSDLPPWTDLGASLEGESTVVMVNIDTGERVPLWAEPDDAADATERLLVIHPAISLEPETTYAVGLQGLSTTAGEPIPVSPVFEAYRDRLVTDIDAVESRRESMEAGITALVGGGVERDDLQLAWTFTTASTDDVTGPIIAMRDTTMELLGDSTPEYTLGTVTDDPEADGLGRFVEGTFSVPNFLSGDGGPGSTLLYDDDGVPTVNPDNPTLQAPFACGIADATLAGVEPAHLVQYGHGLLGSHLEVDAGNIVEMSNEHNAVYCATKWAGFSDDDIPTAVAALNDLSGFPAFIDRQLQGLINQIVLGRMMLAPNGFVTEPAFAFDDGTPLIDNNELFYDGNSQGGIMGMALAGISQDFERAVLGVVGMNYSALLPRSVDFDDFEAIFEPAYPSALDRKLMLSVIQMPWDRTEGAGYVRHVVADPLPGTPPKSVLMHVAFGDWQVSELTAMMAARTMGVPIHRPVTADGRSGEVEPGWGIDTLEYPSSGSGLVIWDSDSDPIPFEQVAPSTSRDPHGDPRSDANVRRQKAAFLFDGQLIDVCDAGPCTAVAG